MPALSNISVLEGEGGVRKGEKKREPVDPWEGGQKGGSDDYSPEKKGGQGKGRWEGVKVTFPFKGP